jgi:phosphatidylglycerol:prolipoprotein diacylglycerol transferase
MFLHSYNPEPILISLGPLVIHWYGVFMVLGIIAGLLITFWLAKYYNITSNLIFDLFFWLIINGIVGARIYDIFLNLNYYIIHPLQTLKIWEGGLAIHGAIIAGIITILFFAKRQKFNFWKIGALLVPGLALGQSIGRWGNYFNQELFGLPTNSIIGIPINIVNRPNNYIFNDFFQPTFLYESIGCFLIFLFLMIFNFYFIKRNSLTNKFYTWSVALYMILYSILRFILEFIRIDETPYFLGLRFPQIVSIGIIFIFLLIIIFQKNAAKEKSNEENNK